MEARVWSDPKVLSRLKNDYVMLALYVDEKTELPENEWYTSEYDGKVKKSIGKQNADFQITRFNNNAQPYYVLLDTNGELLVEPIAYERSISKFVDFLDEGKEKFEFRPLIGKKPRAFKEIYNGGKKEKNADIFLNGSIHIIVGILSVVFTLLLLNK